MGPNSTLRFKSIFLNIIGLVYSILCLTARHIEDKVYNGYMLTTIATILLILWLLGVVGFYAIGGLVHILLVVAIVMFLVRIIQGKNPIQ